MCWLYFLCLHDSNAGMAVIYDGWNFKHLSTKLPHSLCSSGFSPSVSWLLYLSLCCQVSIRSGFSPPKSHKLLEHIDPMPPCAPVDMKWMFTPARCIVSTLHRKLKWVEEGYFARKPRKGRKIDYTVHLIAIQMKFLSKVCSWVLRWSNSCAGVKTFHILCFRNWRSFWKAGTSSPNYRLNMIWFKRLWEKVSNLSQMMCACVFMNCFNGKTDVIKYCGCNIAFHQ